jgi:hypothetical protein
MPTIQTCTGMSVMYNDVDGTLALWDACGIISGKVSIGHRRSKLNLWGVERGDRGREGF